MISSSIVSAVGVEPSHEFSEPFAPHVPIKEIAVVLDSATPFPGIVERFRGSSCFLDIYSPNYDCLPEIMRKTVELKGSPMVRKIGAVKDLSGIDSSSLDGIVIVTDSHQVQTAFLKHTVRTVRELGRIVLVTNMHLSAEELGLRGIAGLKQHRDFGFYTATVRKVRQTLPKVASSRRRKPVNRK